MSADSRRKGHQFERDVVNLFKDWLGVSCQRNLDQYQVADLGDIVIPPFVVECKRYANKPEPPNEWWEQVWTAGDNMNLIPILVYKFDRRPIKAIVPLSLISQDYPTEINATAQLTLDNLMMVMRENLGA